MNILTIDTYSKPKYAIICTPLLVHAPLLRNDTVDN